MKKIDNKKITKNYTKINNSIIRNSSMTIEERFVLIYLLHLPGDWSINMTSMPKSIGLGRDAFRKAYNGLINLGYAKTTKYKDNKGQWQYKQEVSSEPTYLNPEPGNQGLETRLQEPGPGNQVLETRAFTNHYLPTTNLPITNELIDTTTKPLGITSTNVFEENFGSVDEIKSYIEKNGWTYSSAINNLPSNFFERKYEHQLYWLNEMIIEKKQIELI